MLRPTLLATLSLLLGACEEPSARPDAGRSEDPDAGGAELDGGPDPAADGGPEPGADAGPDAGPDVDAGPIVPPPSTCTPPVELYDTSSPSAVIGDGSPAACTEEALRAAVAAGGVITFNCGPDPVIIDLTDTLVLPTDRDTVIDGGGLVTLDAGLQTRHFLFDDPDWMNNPHGVTLQRLAMIHGQAPAGTLYPQDPARPLCAWGYKEGSGGALYVRNGIVHIIDCEFRDNRAALVGPDVGGGAIYALGVPEIVIVGSRFVDNRASNGGAVGLLWANPGVYNSVFEGNTAEGVGMNSVEPGCPMFNHDQQGGAGGNSGALYFDGMNDDGVTYTICGSVFRANKANELGGALFRTPNVSQRDMLIERSLFDANTARMGGVSFIKQDALVVRASTFMANRSGLDVAGNAVGGPFGGLWIDSGSVALENSSFFDNQPSGLDVSGAPSALKNVSVVSSELHGDLTLQNCLLVDTSCDNGLGGDHNLQWPSGTACAAGTTFADPGVGTPGDHGGPTPTLEIAATSPAVGVGANCPSTDQRGEPRDTASCAAGAFEP